MNLLLIHQNFPGRFRELATAGLAMGHQVTTQGSAAEPSENDHWSGMTYLQYSVDGSDQPTARERGDVGMKVCKQLISAGSQPDIVLVHCG